MLCIIRVLSLFPCLLLSSLSFLVLCLPSLQPPHIVSMVWYCCLRLLLSPSPPLFLSKLFLPFHIAVFLLFLPMCITEHFSVLNIIFHSSAHLCSPSMSLLSTSASSSVSTPLPIFVSSENLDIFDFIPPSISFMNTTKSNGP